MMAIRKRNIMIAAVLLLVVLGLWLNAASPTQAPNYTSPVQCIPLSYDYNAWIGLSFLALLISSLIAALFWMTSGLIGDPKQQQAAKEKLWDIVEVAAILSILSLSFVGLEEFGVGNIDTARTYAVITRNTLTGDFTLSILGSTLLSFISKQKPNIRSPAGRAFGVGFSLAPMFRPIFDGLNIIVQLLSTATMAWMGQEFVLCFIKHSMLIVLMPIGIFLRAIGIKSGGNAIIGIAIALYFVYPLLLSLLGQTLTEFVLFDMKGSTEVPDSCIAGKPICCAINADAGPDEPYIPNGDDLHRLSQQKILEGAIYTPLGSTSRGCFYNTGFQRVMGPVLAKLNALVVPLAGAGVFLGNLLLKKIGVSWVIALLPFLIGFVLYGIYEVVMFVFIVSVLMPIFVIFITITLAKEVAKALGTEIDLTSLEKLI